jgi:Uma2 family endonuclease
MMAVEMQVADLVIRHKKANWEVELDVLQGMWSEAQYLKLTDHTRSLIEFTDGYIEVLAMPTRFHQRIIALLYELFVACVRPLGGEVLFAVLRMRVRADKFREPDLLLVLNANDPRSQDRYWLGADLVVEVVSEDDPERDTVEKVKDYAEANVPEYWIVNPLDETITVLTLDGAAYRTHGMFGRGEQATSVLLDGFAIEVTTVFDAR